jgi:hypothetical protein
MAEFNFNRIRLSIINILRENPTFSRAVPSLYTLLCKEVYGVSENYGPNFNRAVQLHRKINANSNFVDRILELDLNVVEKKNEKEIDYDFAFVSYSTEENKDKIEPNINEIKSIKINKNFL